MSSDGSKFVPGEASEVVPGEASKVVPGEASKVVLYGTRWCPYCVAARHLLKSHDIDYENISVDGNSELRQHMEEISGRHTVPQIWIGETHVGGFTELQHLARTDKLDALVKARV